MTPTFVVTLELDGSSFAWLNELRLSHFPPARNVLDAHLTLFHKIDIDGIVEIENALAAQSWRDIDLVFSGPISLGRGVAIAATAPGLNDLRSRLAKPIADRLTPQDRQPFRPHVTIQNKVEPSEARALMTHLATDFTPRPGAGLSVLVWEYLGGPWRLQARLPSRFG